MTTTKPLRKTTLFLVQKAAQDFQAAVQGIANMAVDDGEVPPNTRLDLNSQPPCWVIETPDIQPEVPNANPVEGAG